VTQIAQCAQSALADDSAGCFADDAEYTADAAGLVAHWIV
jgi:hypothetical protein